MYVCVYIYIYICMYVYRREGPLLTLRMFRVAWAREGDFFNDPGGGFSLVLRSGLASREGDFFNNPPELFRSGA